VGHFHTAFVNLTIEILSLRYSHINRKTMQNREKTLNSGTLFYRYMNFILSSEPKVAQTNKVANQYSRWKAIRLPLLPARRLPDESLSIHGNLLLSDS
jgi:hypothetical protein